MGSVLHALNKKSLEDGKNLFLGKGKHIFFTFSYIN